MPTVFDQQFSACAQPGLWSEFGEEAVYGLAAGGFRSIVAIVERAPAAIYDTAGNVLMPELVLRICSAGNTGIRANEVDVGGDWVEVRRHPGDPTLSRFTVVRMIGSDSSTTVVAVK